MITKIEIASYKSIDKLEFELGRINVLIGENGAGKSNILEAIAIAGAAAANKLDNEFITSRGIRVTSPEYMRPAFPKSDALASIELKIVMQQYILLVDLKNHNTAYSKWSAQSKITANIQSLIDYIDILINKNLTEFENVQTNLCKRELVNFCIKKGVDKNTTYLTIDISSDDYTDYTSSDPMTMWMMAKIFVKHPLSTNIQNFLIYSPANSALRTFQREGQIEPLGINGEGLLKLLSVLSRPEYSESLNEIKQSLQILGWFEDLTLTDTDPFAGSRIQIKDRYLDETRHYFDQLSTNEGFLFLLFYFALFSTDLTPKFFAIDNIDASLNPKLCEKLMRELVALAEKHDKQVIFTTHNPAILDGLNLDDDEQRLFVISRNKAGATRMKRVNKPVTQTGERPTRLSELFLRGVLGGLPKGF
jgi:predicted ATPase